MNTARPPHVQSHYLIGYPPPTATERAIARIGAALSSRVSAFRRQLMISELRDIDNTLAQIELMREHDDREEQLAYERQAILRAALRDIDRPTPASHDTEYQVD